MALEERESRFWRVAWPFGWLVKLSVRAESQSGLPERLSGRVASKFEEAGLMTLAALLPGVLEPQLRHPQSCFVRQLIVPS